MNLPVTVGDQGIELPARSSGSYDVYFDDHHAWSFKQEQLVRLVGGRGLVPWPRVMRQWLDGTTQVVIREGSTTLFDAEVSFGTGTGRIAMVGADGIPVMVDKWGLLQRPFEGRSAGVVEQMLDVTEQILEILERECGLHAWLAFGSLLGAAREGKVIGHDSDIDLSYLSHTDNLVDCIREMYDVTRALRRNGLNVMNKSGSFVTVLFTADDGGQSSIDVYSFFYVGEYLHGTATLREVVPPSVIEPLGRLEFEGRMLPVPADTDRMLELSYGARWRVPDPSFQHNPSRGTAARFHGWFGSVMEHRREWERWARLQRPQVGAGPTRFGEWALSDLPNGATVVDIGGGTGRDAIAAARRGHPAHACDYARGAFSRARRIARDEELDATFNAVNLSSRRDAITRAAALAYATRPPRTVLAGGVLDSLEAPDRANLLAMLRMLLGRGGVAKLEYAHDLSQWDWLPDSGGRRFEVDPAEVARDIAALGGHVVGRDTVSATARSAGMGLTRMTVRWNE